MYCTQVIFGFREVIMLKSLWDMITLVKSSFEDWNTTPWSDINVEQMEMDCKKFVKVFKVAHIHICRYLVVPCGKLVNGHMMARLLSLEVGRFIVLAYHLISVYW